MKPNSSVTPILFWKMHGCGNHFVVSYCTRELLPKLDEKFTQNICSTHFGVGADGIMMIVPAVEPWADFDVLMRNPDGSLMGMCGNGIRCVAEFLRLQSPQLSSDLVFNVEGKRIQTSVVSQGIKVDMGVPSSCRDVELAAGKSTMNAITVSVPNPHAVIFVDVLPDAAALKAQGSLIEYNSNFPNRTNVEFVVVRSRDEVDVAVWERGAGATLACGTAACAVVVAGITKGLLNQECRVRLPGGVVTVLWQNRESPVILTGPAVKIFEGEYHYGL